MHNHYKRYKRTTRKCSQLQKSNTHTRTYQILDWSVEWLAQKDKSAWTAANILPTIIDARPLIYTKHKLNFKKL